MNKAILSNWNFMRVLRLVLGLSILGQAFYQADFWVGVAGALFSGMAIFNVGCCGSNGCSVNYQQAK